MPGGADRVSQYHRELLYGYGGVMEKIKTNTVISKWRQSKSQYSPRRGKVVPFIYMSGLWLENLGFSIGQQFEIYSPGNGHLLLKAGPHRSGKGKGKSKGKNSVNINTPRSKSHAS